MSRVRVVVLIGTLSIAGFASGQTSPAFVDESVSRKALAQAKRAEELAGTATIAAEKSATASGRASEQAGLSAGAAASSAEASKLSAGAAKDALDMAVKATATAADASAAAKSAAASAEMSASAIAVAVDTTAKTASIAGNAAEATKASVEAAKTSSDAAKSAANASTEAAATAKGAVDGGKASAEAARDAAASSKSAAESAKAAAEGARVAIDLASAGAADARSGTHRTTKSGVGLWSTATGGGLRGELGQVREQLAVLSQRADGIEAERRGNEVQRDAAKREEALWATRATQVKRYPRAEEKVIEAQTAKKRAEAIGEDLKDKALAAEFEKRNAKLHRDYLTELIATVTYGFKALGYAAFATLLVLLLVAAGPPLRALRSRPNSDNEETSGRATSWLARAVPFAILLSFTTAMGATAYRLHEAQYALEKASSDAAADWENYWKAKKPEKPISDMPTLMGHEEMVAELLKSQALQALLSAIPFAAIAGALKKSLTQSEPKEDASQEGMAAAAGPTILSSASSPAPMDGANGGCPCPLVGGGRKGFRPGQRS